MNEFDLIARYFSRPARTATLGVGDDCAILAPTPGCELLVSKDLLVEGRHFFSDVDPVALGHKTLAVNLSDIAAMGGQPRWTWLGAALPQIDPAWVAGFAEGFYALAERTAVELLGGDTTRGPLTLSVTVMGEVPAGTAIRRDGARPGDDIWVSGQLGLAAAALQARLGRLALPDDVADACLRRLEWPEPRTGLGQALRGLASAMLDVSDGLAGDLGHILARSGVAAELWLAAIPTHGWLAGRRSEMRDCLLAGGDDYELCFTAPQAVRAAVADRAAAAGVDVTRIGMIRSGHGLSVLGENGEPVVLERNGFDHFA